MKEVNDMMYKSEREFLTVQLLEIQRLLEMVGEHPIMTVSLIQNEKDLLKQLGKIPVVKKRIKERRVMARGNHAKTPNNSSHGKQKRTALKHGKGKVTHDSTLS